MAIEYTTWNPSDKSADITLSNGDLTAKTILNGHDCARTILSKSSGKWYWEITVDYDSGMIGSAVGLGIVSSSLSLALGAEANDYAYRSDGKKRNSASAVAYGDSWTTGDIIGIAFDRDAGKVWFSKNGVWQASGNPASGTGEAFSGINNTMFGMFSLYYTDEQLTANFGASAFSYSAPSGFNSGLYEDVPSSSSSSSRSSSSKSSSSSSRSSSSSSRSSSSSSSSSSSRSSSSSSSSSKSSSSSSSSKSSSSSSSSSRSSSSSSSSKSSSSSSSSSKSSSSSSSSKSSSSSSKSSSSSSSSSRSSSSSSSSKSSSSSSSSSKSSSSSSSSFYYNSEPEFYDSTDTILKTSFLQIALTNKYTDEVELHLWANKDDDSGGVLENIKLTVACANGLFSGQNNSLGQECVTEKWVEVKSNGVVGSGIVDDANVSFKAIGGGFTNAIDYLSLGNMPTNTARKIFIKFNIPSDPEMTGTINPRFALQYDAKSSSSSSSRSSSSSSRSSSSSSSSSVSKSSSSRSSSSSSSSRSSSSSSSSSKSSSSSSSSRSSSSSSSSSKSSSSSSSSSRSSSSSSKSSSSSSSRSSSSSSRSSSSSSRSSSSSSKSSSSSSSSRSSSSSSSSSSSRSSSSSSSKSSSSSSSSSTMPDIWGAE